MRTVIIIPARYKSSRFPGKPLASILGKPMILWVADLCSKAVSQDNVYVATEDFKIKDLVEKAGFNAIMTSDKALTGTDRVADAASQIDSDIYINVQGDEPLLNPNDILSIIEAKKNHPNQIINGFCKIDKNEDPKSLNIPKVVFNKDNKMIYMSRHLIPGTKSTELKPKNYYKQVCIYAFNKRELTEFAQYGKKGTMEYYEDIEILRFLDLGLTVRLIETKNTSLAVDIPDDIKRVEQAILRKK